jgi:hypothetical protein
MQSLAQRPSATLFQPWPARLVGWSAVASGLALIVVGEKPYFPSAWNLVVLLATLALYLGMVPIVWWMALCLAARAGSAGGRVNRIAEIAGLTGASCAAMVAILALPRWLSAAPTQILDTSALGAIGLWLIVANALAFRMRLINRVLAIFGVLAGMSWLLAALTMWAELITGARGGIVPTLENVRILAGYVGSALYLLWVVWLGILLLLRKR